MPQSDFWPFAINNDRKEENVGVADRKSLLMQKQLYDMEGEVKEIQMELDAIRRNRQDVIPNLLCPVMDRKVVEKITEVPGNPRFKIVTFKSVPVEIKDKKPAPPDPREIGRLKARFEVLRLQTYAQEMAKLQAELAREKEVAEDERYRRRKNEDKLRTLEQKLKEICGTENYTGFAAAQKQSNVEINSLMTQIRDLKEQIEELTISCDEKEQQVQDYRAKYLLAQQKVEELQRQMNLTEADNKQSSEQMEAELHKMKVNIGPESKQMELDKDVMQFREELLQLAPLPDLLKSAQIQVQEARQLQKLAEENAQQIAAELQLSKEQVVTTVNALNQEKMEKWRILVDNSNYITDLEAKVRNLDELVEIVDGYKDQVLRLEEKNLHLLVIHGEKLNENDVLARELKELKEENARTMSRAKDRSESTRHYLQTQITELERQMISCRAQCRTYQKERDEVRQRTQIQITSLKENFDLVEVRLRGLQKQIILLKQCYSVVFPEDEEKTNTDHGYAQTH